MSAVAVAAVVYCPLRRAFSRGSSISFIVGLVSPLPQGLCRHLSHDWPRHARLTAPRSALTQSSTPTPALVQPVYAPHFLLLTPAPSVRINLSTTQTNLLVLTRGYNIGIRLIDEFLAKAKISKCGSFRCAEQQHRRAARRDATTSAA